jgi:NAD(P)-dependent dehydrogenase (short-subunit alcohol dehydrogenase family)
MQVGNKVIVITGGTGGMGLATARLLGQDGYYVVISDVVQERLDTAIQELKNLKIAATAVKSDIADRKSIDQLARIAQASGHVAGVVHTAGVSPQMGNAGFIIKINAVGTINVAEAFLAIADEGLSLVNVASIAGHMIPKFLVPKRKFELARGNKDAFYTKLTAMANFGPEKIRPGLAYTLSKSFVIWYTAQIAARFGEKNARIVSVSPGTFDTFMGRLEEKSGSGKFIDYAALKRYGKPEEAAELLAFLGCGKAGYISGTDILNFEPAPKPLNFFNMYSRSIPTELKYSIPCIPLSPGLRLHVLRHRGHRFVADDVLDGAGVRLGGAFVHVEDLHEVPLDDDMLLGDRSGKLQALRGQPDLLVFLVGYEPFFRQRRHRVVRAGFRDAHAFGDVGDARALPVPAELVDGFEIVFHGEGQLFHIHPSR